MNEPVLVLAGATASGKTELAVELARSYRAEIVGADSRQVYRGMEIGTAAPSPEQRAAVPHHLIGFLAPDERYSAARFAADAVDAIVDIRRRGKRAIVTGGTGFYLRSLTGGVALAPQYDEALRARLAHEARLHPAEVLHDWLRTRDRKRAAAIEPRDTYRVLRALEIALAQPDARHGDLTPKTLAGQKIPYAVAFLELPQAELDARIARRTQHMLAAGFVEEAERIGRDAVAASAVGYPQAFAHLAGWSTADELRAGLERATRRYARRQRAWFRGDAEAVWLPKDALHAFVRENLRWSAKPD
ncbi:MAG TPA: tRNA (adenosine(37)-N6)-dimethylallyltransferase MiaA [Candidatus Acidoferrales bacterium]|nr:tRNA (adenosine(37)-N6)-dimethylallyltransferase MiaA [Candidatus Acidoferrales bacterium]